MSIQASDTDVSSSFAMNPTNFSGRCISMEDGLAAGDAEMVITPSTSSSSLVAFAGTPPTVGLPFLELPGAEALLEEMMEEAEEDPRHRDQRRRRRRPNFSLKDCRFSEPEDFSVEENSDSHSVVLMPFGGDGLSDSDSDSPPTSSSRTPKRRRLHERGPPSHASSSPQQEVHRRRRPHEIRTKLARLLEAAAGSTARVDILKRSLALPEGLLDVVASHVAQEAEEEPRGLDGCVLHVFFEGRHDRHALGSLHCDPDTAPSFEIRLTLREGRLASSPPSSRLDVGTSYRLVKRRKY